MRWLALALVTGCAGRLSGGCQEGEISFYAARFEGQKTASGDVFHNHAMTAAHRSLAFGTDVEVTVGEHSVHVRINDRGPFARGRILDVSGKAADLLGFRDRGHTNARVCPTKSPD